jgi:hypothetical protein
MIYIFQFSIILSIIAYIFIILPYTVKFQAAFVGFTVFTVALLLIWTPCMDILQ